MTITIGHINAVKVSSYLVSDIRDDNSGTGTGMIFYLRVAPVPDSNRDGYFFSPAGNPTGTRYFTTTIILDCEQVKMCSFCYINYDLFWLLNFTTLLSQIFVEY
jgi:hypothetical protein